MFVHPESGFPFSGPTNLRVRGKFVRAKDSLSKSGWRYLVLGIENCSALFLFEKLTVERDNDASQSEGEDELSDEEKKPAFAPPKHKVGDGEKPFQSANKHDQGHSDGSEAGRGHAVKPSLPASKPSRKPWNS